MPQPSRNTMAGPQHTTAFAVTLMEHMVVPTFVLDADRRVLVWNRACERLTGVAAGELIGTRDHWRAFYEAPRPCLADLVANDDWSTIDKLYTTHQDPATPEHGVHAENWCAMPRRGGRRYLVVDAGPVFDGAGKLIAVVETIRDNTENKLAQIKAEEQANILQHYYDENQRETEMAHRILDHQIRSDLTRQTGVKYEVVPATNFSGDLVLAARAPDGRLYALLADAAGHGLAAAVSVLPVVHEFYRLVEQGQSVAAIVESINFALANSLPTGRFVAAALACLDEGRCRGEIWVGGIPDVMLLSASGELLRRFASLHLPLGVSCDLDAVGTAETFEWAAAARLVMLSDGVVEASAPDGEAFGEERLLTVLAQDPAEAVITNLQTAMATHLCGASAHDDMSVLVVECPAAIQAADWQAPRSIDADSP